MDEEKITQCEQQIANGEIDCKTDYLNDCCFISDAGGSISPLGSGSEFFTDSFGQSGKLFESFGGTGTIALLVVAFLVARFFSSN